HVSEAMQRLALAVTAPALVVEIALQDDGGGHGVDVLLALLASGTLRDEGLLGDGGRHALVVVLERDADLLREGFGELARGLRLRTLAAGEADREADRSEERRVGRE